MRKNAAIMSVIFLLVAACGETGASDRAICDEASEHVSTCLGDQLPSSAGAACDEATAEAMLATDCETLQAEAGDAPDDKDDVAGWAKALTCYYRLQPLTECFPENWRGEYVFFTIGEIVDGVERAKPGVTVRFRHQTYPEVAVQATSDGFGKFRIRVPDTAFTPPRYFIDVIVDDEVVYTADSGGYMDWIMEVHFAEDGTPSVCGYASDTWCRELPPAQP